MVFDIKITNNVDLLHKKQEVLTVLHRSTGLPYGEMGELTNYAESGLLDRDERASYDELNMILALLGEAHYFT